MRERERERKIKINYLQTSLPDELNFRLKTLSVTSAIMFVEKYTQILTKYDSVPHITYFIDKTVQIQLVNHARKDVAKNGNMLYTGLAGWG